MLFWQQSLGEAVDVMLSPWPVHRHGGGLVNVSHSKPESLYPELCARLGRKFPLHRYWGPLAGLGASRWIGEATAEVMGMDLAPDLLFTYIPHLDYDLQRFGPNHPKAERALEDTLAVLSTLLAAAEAKGYEVVLFGDYAIGEVERVLFPNQVLARAGLLSTRRVGKSLYPNLHESRAFAVADHECAHVYLLDETALEDTAKALQSMPGEFECLHGDTLEPTGAAHPGGGALVLRGAPGTWFSYRYWETRKQAPDFANHVDIHNKPGYDPCELFFGWNPMITSTDESKVRGSHGSVADGRQVACASTCPSLTGADSLLGLARRLKDTLKETSS
ncbi:MAG: alkaline phosphatase family protein, partial [Planctomycetota bacterium]|jgi:hypothetical protein